MNIRRLLTLIALVTGLTNLAIHCGHGYGEKQSGRHSHGHPGHHGPHDGHGWHHMHDHPMVKYHLQDGNQQAGKLDVYNKDTKNWDVYTLSSETSPITKQPVKHEHKHHEEGKHRHGHEGKEGKHAERTKPHHHHVKSRKDAQGNNVANVLDVYENDKWVVYKK